MKKLLLLVLVFIPARLIPQSLHSPAEILKIMENSKISYEMNLLENPVPCTERTDNIVDQNFYRVKTDSSIVVYSYKLKEEAVPVFEKAESFFNTRNLDSARIFYEKVLEIDPSYYKVMTFIGQMYGSMGNLDESLKWYKKIIELNYIDYLAHWLIADIYRLKGDIKEAVNEITIASILNRNNPRLKKSQAEIYQLAKIKTTDWCFNPQVEINSDGNTVKVAFNEVWIGYAMPKALWKYETGYKESMGVTGNQYSTLEDKECLLNLLVALQSSKADFKKYPEIVTLKKAVDKEYLSEYILYEILLPEHPFTASHFSDETINRIKDYVLTVRYAK